MLGTWYGHHRKRGSRGHDLLAGELEHIDGPITHQKWLFLLEPHSSRLLARRGPGCAQKGNSGAEQLRGRKNRCVSAISADNASSAVLLHPSDVAKPLVATPLNRRLARV